MCSRIVRRGFPGSELVRKVPVKPAILIVLIGILIVGGFSCSSNSVGPSAVSLYPAWLTVERSTDSSMAVAWNFGWDSRLRDTVFRYELLYSRDIITAANWAGAARLRDTVVLMTPYRVVRDTIRGLDPGTVYYFAVRYASSSLGWSELSNVEPGKTLANDERLFGHDYTVAAGIAALEGGSLALVANVWESDSLGASVWGISVTRVDPERAVTWEKVVAGTETDVASCAAGTPDGGIIIGGRIGGSAAVMKLDGDGNEIWRQMLSADTVIGIDVGLDGRCIVAGNLLSAAPAFGDLYTASIDASGSKLWESSFHFYYTDVASATAITTDGGAVVTGRSGFRVFGTGSLNGYICRITSDGQLRWHEVLPQPSDSDSYIFPVAVAASGDSTYLVLADVLDPRQGRYTTLLMYDTLGVLVRQRNYAAPTGAVDNKTMVELSAGGYALIGTLYSNTDFGYQSDILMMLVDVNGNLLSYNARGGLMNEEAVGAVPLADGHFAVVGTTSSFGCVRRTYLLDQ